MQIEKVIALFGSPANVARVLNTTTQNVSGWIAKGVIPQGRQYELQVKSYGVLVADNWDPQWDYFEGGRPIVEVLSQ